MVAGITAVAAVVGMIAVIVLANRYSYALTNYGFSQGDIGKAMVTFADSRSATRAAIGYSDATAIETALSTHDKKKADFENYYATVEKTLTTEYEQTEYADITSHLEQYGALDAEIIAQGATTDAGNSLRAQERCIAELDPLYDEVYSQMADLLILNVDQGNSLSGTLQIMSGILLVLILVVLVIAVLGATKLGVKIAKGIAEPLEAMSSRLKTFAQGDLATPFPEIETKDEVADMIISANEMSRNLGLIIKDVGHILTEMAGGNYVVTSQAPDRYTGEFTALIEAMRTLKRQMLETLGSIEDASSQVSAGSSNLADASQSLAEGATDQAGAVEELQATITSIAETIERGAETAENSYEQAKKYADEADRSRLEMKAMVDAMERINETSKRIENIISEIEDIASQTNLLSLNASIEAARAGEAGRGFAVVADQIRQLAEQSTRSAVDTRELIEGSLKEIFEGNKAAERAAESIDTVVNGIKQIAIDSKGLSDISADQAATMRQAEEGVNQISEVVQSNSATAEESSATSEELSAQAASLDELISKFILK